MYGMPKCTLFDKLLSILAVTKHAMAYQINVGSFYTLRKLSSSQCNLVVAKAKAICTRLLPGRKHDSTFDVMKYL